MKISVRLLFITLLGSFILNNPAIAQQEKYILLQPSRVFDGETMHQGWWVLVKNNIIEAAGPSQSFSVPATAQRIDLKGTTLLPGFIEGHSHLFLHPYNETSWDDQVLKESRAERTARAVNHARATLLAGFTTVRDLGTEGAMYDDVGLKTAIEKRLIPGPRMIVATRDIVAKGTYGPQPGSPDIDLPQGAAEVTGMEELAGEVRTQIGKGADFIKIYADYRWGLNREAQPTFTLNELALAASITKSGGRQLVVHASTPEGMTRGVMAGVSTIEHGDGGTAEVFRLMKEKGVALCPTLAAGDAVEQYNGWRKGTDPEPDRITKKKNSFKSALQAGVTICFGGDVGVFAHGDNAREMEMMVEYGMKPLDVLRSATSVNADVFGYGNMIGRIRKGLLADIVVVEGDVEREIKNVRKVRLVMKDGSVVSLGNKL
jgi:imidazolonepropionase-like amidohydrolase